jgi:predicted membrane channel-forming protein YqfA (hemolysin III family)
MIGRRGTDLVRIPRLRAVVTAVATLAVIGVAVFLRRYRGADRTAVALSLLVGGGVCLMVGLAWFHVRFCQRVMTRRALRGIGLRYGALAGTLTGGIGIVLLAVRWGMDQLASPASDPFPAAFWRALVALGEHLADGAVAYLASGALVGALVGLFIAEAIGISADRIPAAAEGKGDL